MYEKVIHNTEELNAMAAHLRMAQNFPELRLLAAERLAGRGSCLQRFPCQKRSIHRQRKSCGKRCGI